MSDSSATLRSGLLGLAVLSILGIAAELATGRHWRNAEQQLLLTTPGHRPVGSKLGHVHDGHP
ncbi:hypothetical protein [Streptosporangium sp. NPDC087985]|uniref:hypothetical protein n=1 Tax=Streptosporangium sp. NPDC087985 TaxID=3366196 RepID=UPI003814997C